MKKERDKKSVLDTVNSFEIVVVFFRFSFARDLKSVVFVIVACFLFILQSIWCIPYFHSSELFVLLQVAECESVGTANDWKQFQKLKYKEVSENIKQVQKNT